jgi:hypothetical protein
MSCLGPFRHAKTILDVFMKSQTYRFESKERNSILWYVSFNLCQIEILASSVDRQQRKKLVYLSCAEITTDGNIYLYFSFVGLKFCTNGLHHCIYFASLSNPTPNPDPPPLCMFIAFLEEWNTHIYKSLQNFKFVHYLVYLCIYVNELFYAKLIHICCSAGCVFCCTRYTISLPRVGRQIVPDQCIPNIFSWTTGGSFRRIL